MGEPGYFREKIETMPRDDLDAVIDERVRYTIQYANDHSPFYRKWFREHAIDISRIREHEDLLDLPIISGSTIRNNQPPITDSFQFLSANMDEIYTIHETSGTSGNPKSFFLTWQDWLRYSEKYARIFRSYGISKGDRIVVCASYGMNVGATMMTLAARRTGSTIIPEGKCTFPIRVIRNYRPTVVIGSVFKLIRLARRLSAEGIDPLESGIERLVVGGESFAEAARIYLKSLWNCEIYNTYGSTEGTMCGECVAKAGLHVPEDLIHMDLYNPRMDHFVPDGSYGRIILTKLLPVGERCGTLLINYDTEDATAVVSRDRCACGRTSVRIKTPEREGERFWIEDRSFNRVDVERGVFQPENMVYLTGEYEAFLYGGRETDSTVLRVSLECHDPASSDTEEIKEIFLKAFFRYKSELRELYISGSLEILFHFTGPGELELYKVKGRPKRVVDRR
jgi:coenzyme F390 synthetase